MAVRVDVKVKMNPKFLVEIRKITNKAIGDTVRELREEIKDVVSVPFPPSSRPGQPPRRRTGETRRSIFAKKMKSNDWVVGIKKMQKGRENLGIWLELGTGGYRQSFPAGAKGRITGEYATPGKGLSSMQARPFLLSTFVSRGPAICKSKLKSAGVSGSIGLAMIGR